MIFHEKLGFISYIRNQKLLLHLRNSKAGVEKEIEAHIICLRTDRGGEFNLNEL